MYNVCRYTKQKKEPGGYSGDWTVDVYRVRVESASLATVGT